MLRTIITSANFGDFLALTLPHNRHHWQETLVLTCPGDEESQTIAKANDAAVFVTDAFTRNGYKFNKYLALEEALDHFGRHGLICLVDVDVFWPQIVPPFSYCRRGHIYTFRRRRLLLDVTAPIPLEKDWHLLPMSVVDKHVYGYTQIFWADDPVLGKPPWHMAELPGGDGADVGDMYLQDKWPEQQRIFIDRDLLHLGEHGHNWFGRKVPRRIVDG